MSRDVRTASIVTYRKGIGEGPIQRNEQQVVQLELDMSKNKPTTAHLTPATGLSAYLALQR